MLSTAALFVVAPLLAPGGISKAPFGTTKAGKAVTAYTLTNGHGTTAKIIDYGAVLTRLQVKDKTGLLGDVALGEDELEPYEGKVPYFGATVGRYANRIAKGRFTVDGKTYKLAINNGPNSLHGGLVGYDKRMWKAVSAMTSAGPTLTLSLVDPNMTEGYPGTVNVKVRYTLTNQDALRIEYWASTNKATPINLTNHTYFNLKDGGNSDVMGHHLMIAADAYTPVDKVQIPTGKIAPVRGTAFDFTKMKTIGRDFARSEGGYDHNFVLRGKGKFALAAKVVEPTSGRVMQVYTDQPGVQLYTSNFLDGTITGHGGATYSKHHAFCLETQHFPDSPNHKNFPSSILRPGKPFYSKTEYRFSVVK